MKKRMTTAAILSLALLAQSNCMAAYSGEVKNGKIIVSGTELAPGAVINLTAFPKGVSPEKAEELIAMAEQTVGADGTVTFEFGVRVDKEETKDAEAVTIYVKENGGSGTSFDVNYSIKDYNEFINTLKGADADAMLIAFTNPDYKNVMTEFGMEDFFGITSESIQKNTVKLFEGCLDKSDVTPANVSAAFTKAYAVAQLNARTSDSAETIAKINPEFEGTKFSEITDSSLKKWITDNAKTRTYDSVQAYLDAYELDNILYIINHTKSTNMASELDKYKDELNIANDSDYKAYAALDTTKKGKASDKIVTSLSKKNVSTVSDLLSVIKSSMEEKKESTKGSTTGSVFSSDNKKTDFTVPAKENTSDKTDDKTNDNKETTEFTDMDGFDWAKTAVNALREKGIISGMTDTTFAPNAPVTREQFVKMVVSATSTYDENAESNFDDVAKDAWYYKYVSSGVKAGLVSGISETEFGTGMEITRQDAAVILYRAAKAANVDLDNAEKQDFTDADAIAEYANEAVEVLSGKGVINGMGNGEFAPTSTCTRAQAAQIIYRLFFA